jgi:hypothetical protein
LRVITSTLAGTGVSISAGFPLDYYTGIQIEINLKIAGNFGLGILV